MRDIVEFVLTELPLYGWAWSIPTLLACTGLVVAREVPAWRRATRDRDRHRRRTIIVTTDEGEIGRA